MSKFPYHSPSSFHSHFFSRGQAKVSAIRFYPTSPPDSGKFPLESDGLLGAYVKHFVDLPHLLL